jgi:hypothetical protein
MAALGFKKLFARIPFADFKYSIAGTHFLGFNRSLARIHSFGFNSTVAGSFIRTPMTQLIQNVWIPWSLAPTHAKHCLTNHNPQNDRQDHGTSGRDEQEPK